MVVLRFSFQGSLYHFMHSVEYASTCGATPLMPLTATASHLKASRSEISYSIKGLVFYGVFIEQFSRLEMQVDAPW